MSKFKVGDKVRVVRNNGDDFDGIKIGDTGEVVEICKGKYPIYLKINNHDQYAFKEEELELYDEYFVGGNKMELTFKEVIANIKENEVWKSEFKSIQKRNGIITIENLKGSSNIFAFNDSIKYKLQRKEYTFEEAFKAFMEGKRVESCENVTYKINNNKDNSYWMNGVEYYFDDTMLSINEIRGKWYIND